MSESPQGVTEIEDQSGPFFMPDAYRRGAMTSIVSRRTAGKVTLDLGSYFSFPIAIDRLKRVEEVDDLSLPRTDPADRVQHFGVLLRQIAVVPDGLEVKHAVAKQVDREVPLVNAAWVARTTGHVRKLENAVRINVY
jgi:hypothetical protein